MLDQLSLADIFNIEQGLLDPPVPGENVFVLNRSGTRVACGIFAADTPLRSPYNLSSLTGRVVESLPLSDSRMSVPPIAG